jgi:3alpha(or 20beta)-hydroxysteroid dehydrogenase
MSSDVPLAGRVALVTGAAGGIGGAIVRRLRAAGARVIAADRVPGNADPAGARFQPLDVTDEGSWKAAMDGCAVTEGRLDILVNCAGILRAAPIPETSREMFDAVVAVNQTGVFLGMKAAFALMARQGGSIINVSSTAGLKAAANHVAYVASKFAVTGMTKVAAIEFGPKAIRVNSVHPGLIDTPMVAPFFPQGTAAFAHRQLLDQPGQPQDVAELVQFLASDAARFCTGGEFVCDGGYVTGGR